MSSDLTTNLTKYANLIVNLGVNVQPKQTIIIYAAVDQVQLTRLITKAAYAKGAAEVIIKWDDPVIDREFLTNADPIRLRTPYTFEKQAATELMNKKASRISILSNSPDAFKTVPTDQLQAYKIGKTIIKQPVMKATMNNDISWLVVAAASPEWAQLVYPTETVEDATNHLWQTIFAANRLNTANPETSWAEHIAFLDNQAAWLNSNQFDALHYQSANTDLTIGLPANHVWKAAGDKDRSGNSFVPNMPTEEVFTAPDNRRIDGTVASTLPLSYNGQIINGIQLTFESGKIIAATAKEGTELLTSLIDTDAGSHSLGEVALVPEDSPIAQTKTIFYNTLFDENASDHIAIGAGYPFNIQNGTNMTADQLAAAGLNQSDVHVDFMIGSKDMNITGITKTQQEIPIMQNGNWV
ncbi:aminopeptidase [Lentilactobacillus senioris]|uniref:aminopeptidase n=1 Tax=Lentilactobacillus senioris TaxID=931534 RepID=UPI00227E7D05|nr:aminopeptidase [Lentilactobacillus senioris]MCY9806696.1 aminopeptidase [Lentilactobacillus senioris]